MSADFLKLVDARITRAEAQVSQIIADAQEWTKGNQITTEGELLPGRLGFQIRIAEMDELSIEAFSFPAGECLHNLRSALDNLAYAMARLKKDPPDKPKAIEFPISLTEQAFNQTTKRMLPQLPSDIADALRAMQPFQRAGRVLNGVYEGMPSDDPLLLLHRINISDKHHVPVAATLLPKEMHFSSLGEFESDEAAARNVPPKVEIVLPLRRGQVFCRTITADPLVQISQTFQIQGHIALMAGEDVIEMEPALRHLAQQVRIVIEYFRRFF